MSLLNFINPLKVIYLDAAEPWQLGFQDSATPVMEGINVLHDNILFYLIVVVVGVLWALLNIIYNFASTRTNFTLKYLRHGTLIEIIWTITPALILISIALPSFKLLYLMDEVIDPAITIKAIGHQWYWSYEYSDYMSNEGESLGFDSYMVPTDELKEGDLRLLEVDNRIVVPVNTHIRVVVTAADVLHSWAVPSLGIKMDAVPGRLNQTSMIIKREGVYYGQCSEICGVQHGFMPIVVEAVNLENYVAWVSSQLNK
jgi:cytochrome c oxidase subunit 2